MSELKARLFDNNLPPFERLCLLMEILRSPEGCAWDRAQNHKSLLPYLIEEAYEVVEAIENEDYPALREELGDLMCQIVFHAQLAREKGAFDAMDSVNDLIDKLVRRHPHVFGEQRELQPQQVRDQWETIKNESGEKESVLSGLPKSMPALTMAFRMGEKAGGVGFDWKRAEDVFAKIQEEIAEIRAELDSEAESQRDRLEDEIGDLLFAAASLSRKLGVEPETALKRALGKFFRRFEALEAAVKAERGKFSAYALEELEAIWQRQK